MQTTRTLTLTPRDVACYEMFESLTTAELRVARGAGRGGTEWLGLVARGVGHFLARLRGYGILVGPDGAVVEAWREQAAGRWRRNPDGWVRVERGHVLELCPDRFDRKSPWVVNVDDRSEVARAPSLAAAKRLALAAVAPAPSRAARRGRAVPCGA